MSYSESSKKNENSVNKQITTKKNVSLKIRRIQKISEILSNLFLTHFTIKKDLVEGLALEEIFISLFLAKLDPKYNHYSAGNYILTKYKEKTRSAQSSGNMISNVYIYEKFFMLFQSFFCHQKLKKMDYFKAINFLSTIYNKFIKIEDISSLLQIFILEQSFNLISFEKLLNNMSSISEIERKIVGSSIIEALTEDSILKNTSIIFEKNQKYSKSLSKEKNIKIFTNNVILCELSKFVNKCTVSTISQSALIRHCLFSGFLYSFLIKKLSFLFKKENENEVEEINSLHNQTIKFTLSFALLHLIESFQHLISLANKKFPDFNLCFSWIQSFSSSYYNFMQFIQRFLIFGTFLKIETLSVLELKQKVAQECWQSTHVLGIFSEVFQQSKGFKLWVFQHLLEIYLIRNNEQTKSKKYTDAKFSTIEQKTDKNVSFLTSHLASPNKRTDKFSNFKPKPKVSMGSDQKTKQLGHKNDTNKPFYFSQDLFKNSSSTNRVHTENGTKNKLDFQKINSNRFGLPSLHKRSTFHANQEVQEFAQTNLKNSKKINFIANGNETRALPGYETTNSNSQKRIKLIPISSQKQVFNEIPKQVRVIKTLIERFDFFPKTLTKFPVKKNQKRLQCK